MPQGLIPARSRNATVGCVSLVVAWLTGACTVLENQYSTDPAFGESTGRRQVSTPGDSPTFDLNKDCIPAEREPDGSCKISTLRKIDNLSNPEAAAILRDRLQDYLMMRSDQMCERHRSGILSTQSVTNFAMSTVTTGLSATAAIVLAPATNILAALGAITSGTRSAFNADIYQKYVGPAVVKKINDTRADKRKEILAKRTTQPVDAAKPRTIKPVSEYTPEGAVGDVELYNQYCSFAWGLASLAETNAKFSDTALGIQQRIDVLRKQQLDNLKQVDDLTAKKDYAAAGRLKDVNGDISRQIMVLQQQLLTAPTSVDTPAK